MSEPASKKYTQNDVSEALRLVREGSLSLNKASQMFGIPYATLGDKLRGRRPVNPQPKVLVPHEVEQKLVNFLKESARRGFGKSRADIVNLVKQLLDASGVVSTKTKDNKPSKQWLKDFFKRHQDLSDRTPSALGKERALVSREGLSAWFSDMKQYIDSVDPNVLLSPERLYNADETGFSLCPNSKRIIAEKGSKHVYTLTNGTRQNMTVMACCSATGHYLPPLIIFPYKRMPSYNLLDGFEEASFQLTANGWINQHVFLTWLRDCFVPAIAEKPKPVILFVDGHSSHASSLDISDICNDNGILIYCLKSHASHLIQPLDQSLFGAMKSAWEVETKAHLLRTGQNVSIRTFASVLKPVWQKTTRPEIAFNGFSKSGLFPFNPERVLNSEKLAPNMTFQKSPQPHTQPLTQPQIQPPTQLQKQPLVTAEPPAYTQANQTTGPQTKAKALPSQLENIKKLLEFTANAGPQQFNIFWDQYVQQTSPVDEHFTEFKQLLDHVVKPAAHECPQPTQNHDTVPPPTQNHDTVPPPTQNHDTVPPPTQNHDTVDSILSLPHFSKNEGKVKQPSKKAMPMAISGTEFREYLIQKEKEKEKLEQEKEMRKVERENNKKRKLVEQEEKKKMAEERKKRKIDEKKKKEEERLQKKRLAEAAASSSKKDESESDSDDGDLMNVVYDDESEVDDEIAFG